MEDRVQDRTDEPEPLSEAQELVDYIEEISQQRHIPYHVKSKLVNLIRKLAELDPLTRCLKNEYFWREVRLALKSSNNEKRHMQDRRSRWLGLWVIDVGHFKNINDVIGHATGNMVLRRFARILRSSVRHRTKVDIVGRLGGDEFGVLLSEVTDLQGLWRAIQRFQSRVSERNWERVHPLLADTFYPRPDLGAVCLNVESIQYVVDPEEIAHIADIWFQSADKLQYRSKGHSGDPFLRCKGYNRETGELEDVDTEMFRLSLEQERRHQ